MLGLSHLARLAQGDQGCTPPLCINDLARAQSSVGVWKHLGRGGVGVAGMDVFDKVFFRMFLTSEKRADTANSPEDVREATDTALARKVASQAMRNQGGHVSFRRRKHKPLGFHVFLVFLLSLGRKSLFP